MVKDRQIATQSLVEQDNECSICYDPMRAKNSVMTLCKHTFHKDCLRSWTTSQKENEKFKSVQTCPLCRAPLAQEPSYWDRFLYFFSCTKTPHSD